jgi:hypothetical protein
MKMPITRRALVTTGATVALTSVAAAQGQPQGSNEAPDFILDHEALHLGPKGELKKLKITEYGGGAIKRHDREMAGRALFYREGNRNYVLHDQKMADGSMLFDHAGEWQS